MFMRCVATKHPNGNKERKERRERRKGTQRRVGGGGGERRGKANKGLIGVYGDPKKVAENLSGFRPVCY